jgi:MFS transporter, DHA2 family, methylenomycin A resistance protein
MVILDTMVVNVAVPSMGHDLRAGVSALQWVVAGYTVMFAGLLLSAGTLGDRVGPKRILEAGLAVFTAASAACAFAPDAGFLIAARLVQGAGAALTVPASLALLAACYPDARDRAHAFGLWGGIAGVAAASGPVVGGLLIAGFGWRSVFAVNLPFGVLGLVGTARYLPDVPGQRRRADIPGQLLGIAALGALATALIEAGSLGWTAVPVLAGFAVTAVATTAFIITERRSPSPVLPLSVLRNRGFSTGSAVGLLINLGFYGQLFVATLYFQDLRGYSALITGLALLPEGAMASAGSVLSGRIMARTGPHVPMVGGLALGAAGLLGWLVAGQHTPYAVLVVPLIATGLGMSLTMPAATVAVLGSAPPGRAGLASGVINTARQMGGAIGVALLGSLVAHRAGFTGGMRISMLVAAASFGAACIVAASQVMNERRILQDYLPHIRTSGYLRRGDQRFGWQQLMGTVVRHGVLGFTVPVDLAAAGALASAAQEAADTPLRGDRGRGRRDRGDRRCSRHRRVLRRKHPDDRFPAEQRVVGVRCAADRSRIPAGLAVR